MRKRYSESLKFKVALEACSDKITIRELSKKHNVAPSLVQKWKTHLKVNGSQIFSQLPFASQSKHHEIELQKLYEQIGRLTVEKNYLQKNSAWFKADLHFIFYLKI